MVNINCSQWMTSRKSGLKRDNGVGCKQKMLPVSIVATRNGECIFAKKRTFSSRTVNHVHEQCHGKLNKVSSIKVFSYSNEEDISFMNKLFDGFINRTEWIRLL